MERTEAPRLSEPELDAPLEHASDWMHRIARRPASAPVPVRRRRRFRVPSWVNVVFFVATCVTVGSMQGPLFAMALMTILLAHEMGHYVTAHRAGVQQTLPFFIPAPTLLGTLGAMIFLRSPPPNRRVLLNIAVMGPYAGLLLAIPAVAWGLAHPVPPTPSDVRLGSSLLVAALRWMFALPGDGAMHPVAQAGWFGLFVTSLNLIPAGQLDGGHVTYALFGQRARVLSMLVAGGLFVYGAAVVLIDGPSRVSGTVWLSWSVMLMLFGLRHPRIADEMHPLSRSDKLNAWFALTVFGLTFVPIPFTLMLD